jgi:hypothetical protein
VNLREIHGVRFGPPPAPPPPAPPPPAPPPLGGDGNGIGFTGFHGFDLAAIHNREGVRQVNRSRSIQK